MGYREDSSRFEERAKELVSKMTLEEKAGQTVYGAPAIERLGIPAYNWWNEALHGVARAGTATVFPQAIAMAAAFDEELLQKVAEVIAEEGRAKYNAAKRHGDRGIYKGLTFWSPNVNIFRDPRWGRGHETYGEDPYLTSRLGVAFVKGLQGNGTYMKAAACAKHYAVHSGPENLRHEFDARVSEKDLYETYLPAFKALVQEAGVESVMGAYNRTNGEPCCGSETLLQKILREEWGFQGHVVSDCWALQDFHMNHKVTKTATESVALALKNGCDLNCGCTYLNMLLALQEGLITEEEIDRAVIRLMTTRMKLGMFEQEIEYDKIPYEKVACKKHLELARETARRSLVLLKNDGSLPLDRSKIRTIGVIGPNADSREVLLGNYNGTPPKYITVLEGIQQMAGADVRVHYSCGCDLFKEKTEDLAEHGDRFAEAVSVAEQSDIVVLCVGLDASIEGEEGDASNEYAAGDKKDLNLPEIQQELIRKVSAVGKPVVLVMMSGSAMNLLWESEHVNAILQAWYPGAEGGLAVAELLFGKFSPSGKLPVTIYRTNEELPDFTDYSMENRTYRYMKNPALYPFGYGLSYTDFSYQSQEIEKTCEGIKVTVSVKNTGKMAGYEIVQCYVKTGIEGAPKHSLRGFHPVYLKAGAEENITFWLAEEDFAVVNEQGRLVLSPGEYEIYVGGGQPDARTYELTGRAPVRFAYQRTEAEKIL